MQIIWGSLGSKQVNPISFYLLHLYFVDPALAGGPCDRSLDQVDFAFWFDGCVLVQSVPVHPFF